MNQALIDAVLGYTAKPARSNLLRDGVHTVKILDWKPIDSFTDWSTGELKANLPPFVDPDPQLGVMVGNDNGVAFIRLNLLGYDRWDDLSDKEQKSGDFEKVVFHNTAYACVRNKKNQLERVVNEQKTSDAESLIDSFMSAVGMTNHSVSELGKALENETEFQITVKIEIWEGREQQKVSRFRQLSQVTSEADDDFTE